MGIIRRAKGAIKGLIVNYKYHKYNLKKVKIQEAVFSKEKIKVVFFVLYESMWKSDDLFRLLMQNKRFDPYIISTPYPNHPVSFSKDNQMQLELFFKSRKFPFIKGFDFDTSSWFDIKSFRPDIVFYQQPYNAGYDGFKIESLWDNCLFGYIPYCFALEKDPFFYNTLLLNICWRYFVPSSIEADMMKSIMFNKGRNVIVSGAPMADRIMKPTIEEDYRRWKCTDKSLKRIIWAPHHSILPGELGYSNFLEIAEDMLDLACQYKSNVQFIFKPHPVLKRKLYKLPDWGEERTNNYYQSWANNSNTAVVEGDYVDIFKSSDAMIHDSASFTAEYLYTMHPVAYLAKSGHEEALTDFGRNCYNLHYKLYTIQDIQAFIDNVVINGKDSLKLKREEFVNNYLLPPHGRTMAENSFNEFLGNLKYDDK